MIESSPLDQNIERLMSVAPRRQRLTSEARARIERSLRAQWDSPRTLGAPRSLSRTRRLRLVPAAAMMAAAAAILFLVGQDLLGSGDEAVSRGATSPTELASAEARALDESPGVDELDGAGDRGAPLAGEAEAKAEQRAALIPRETEAGAPTTAVGSDDPGDDPAGSPAGDSAGEARPTASGPGEPGSLFGRLLAPPATASAPGEEIALAGLPNAATLWVKPMVRLPQVADPTAYRVEVTWSAQGEAGEAADDGRLSASFGVQGALEASIAMGTKEAWVQVEVPGYAPAGARVSLAEAAEGSLALDLTPGVRLVGEVLEQRTGQPIPGAVVVAVDQVPLDALDVNADPSKERLPQPYAVADQLGRFELTDVSPRAAVRLRASAQGFAPTEIAVDARSEISDPVRLSLGAGASVEGLVERKDGTPFAGALVIASKQDGDPSAALRPVMTFGADTTDASGRYRIEGLPTGFYVVLLFDPTRNRIPLEFRQLNVQDTSALQMDFRAAVSSKALTLAGTLITGDGQGAAGTTLTLSRLDGSLDPGSDWRVTDTDSDGRFAYADLAAGEYALHEASDGFGRMRLVWIGSLDSSQDLQVTLADTTLQIDAAPASMDAAEQSFQANATWAIFERWREAEQEWFYAGRSPLKSGSAGTQAAAAGVRVEHLPPGRYRAVLVGPGHGASWTEELDIESGRTARAAVALRPGGRLNLTVLVDEKPAAGARVEILDSEGRPIPQQEPVVTDSKGQALYLSVPYGDLTVRCVSGGELLGEASLALDQGQAAPRVEIRL